MFNIIEKTSSVVQNVIKIIRLIIWVQWRPEQEAGKECQWDNLPGAEMIVEMLSRLNSHNVTTHHNWREEDEPWYENVKIYYCLPSQRPGEAECLFVNEISWQCVCMWHISEHILSNEDDKILEFSPTQTILIDTDKKHQQRNHRNFILLCEFSVVITSQTSLL